MRRRLVWFGVLLVGCSESGVEPAAAEHPIAEMTIEGHEAALLGSGVLHAPEALPHFDIFAQVVFTAGGAEYSLNLSVPSSAGTGSFVLERNLSRQEGLPIVSINRAGNHSLGSAALVPLGGVLEILAMPVRAGDVLDVRLGRVEFQDLCGDSLVLASLRLRAQAVPQAEVLPEGSRLGPETALIEKKARSFVRLELPGIGLLESPGDLAFVLSNEDGGYLVLVEAVCPSMNGWNLLMDVDPWVMPGTYDRILEIMGDDFRFSGPLVLLKHDRGTRDTEDDVRWLLGLGKVTIDRQEGVGGRLEMSFDEASDAYFLGGPEGHPFPEVLRVGRGFVRLELLAER